MLRYSREAMEASYEVVAGWCHLAREVVAGGVAHEICTSSTTSSTTISGITTRSTSSTG